MDMKFLEGCKTARQARRRAPWAAVARKVEGGYMAYRYVSDFNTWNNQR